MILDALRVPIGWKELARRTASEVMADNCFGLAAELAYYFFLALFPALIFLVAIISFVPIEHLLDTITSALARVAPAEVLTIIQNQVLQVAHGQDGGLLTLGMLGTIWSTSSGLEAIIGTLNQAYDIQEARSWWKVKATALGLTLVLACFVIVATVLVLSGPALAEHVAAWFHLGREFEWAWAVVKWPVIFGLVSAGVAIVYYYAPDARQEWIWITPGSVLATVLWLLISMGFRIYLKSFGSFNATYGAIGGIIIVLLWFYLSGLALLIGAELNAEIEHASPYGKDPGEKVPGQKRAIGRLAERLWKARQRQGSSKSSVDGPNCAVDAR